MGKFNCLEYPKPSCVNCGLTCEDEKDPANYVCDYWEPCRGAHPSTPNPCEGFYDKWEDYPLCAGKCEHCEHTAFMK